MSSVSAPASVETPTPGSDVSTAETPVSVWFIGAGPGDPELLTVKGQRLIREADLLMYTGSLVPAAVLAGAKASARIVDSAPLTLNEIHAQVRDCCRSGGIVARVHTGDPSLYGTLVEQMRLLDADSIAYAVVPGITSAAAAAAAARLSFTAPEITQSLILTRLEGRTPVPASEALHTLAAHHTALAIYLSANEGERLQAELLKALPPETPILCAHKVSWPDQKLVWTCLCELASTITRHQLNRQTLFLVLPAQGSQRSSRLYAPDFSHAARRAAE